MAIFEKMVLMRWKNKGKGWWRSERVLVVVLPSLVQKKKMEKSF
jgi:hypothetical protein